MIVDKSLLRMLNKCCALNEGLKVASPYDQIAHGIVAQLEVPYKF